MHSESRCTGVLLRSVGLAISSSSSLQGKSLLLPRSRRDLAQERLQAGQVLRAQLHILVVAPLRPQWLRGAPRGRMQRLARANVHHVIIHPLHAAKGDLSKPHRLQVASRAHTIPTY